jgi:hypothetical protein
LKHPDKIGGQGHPEFCLTLIPFLFEPTGGKPSNTDFLNHH